MSKLQHSPRGVYRRLRAALRRTRPVARLDHRDTARALALWAGVLV